LVHPRLGHCSGPLDVSPVREDWEMIAERQRCGIGGREETSDHIGKMEYRENESLHSLFKRAY
jgi:hypothetical protein